jgi:hypothetical protein
MIKRCMVPPRKYLLETTFEWKPGNQIMSHWFWDVRARLPVHPLGIFHKKNARSMLTFCHINPQESFSSYTPSLKYPTRCEKRNRS